MIRTPESRLKTVVLTVVAVGIVIPGGYGFIEKFIQFIRTLHSEPGGGFTIVPIMNYLLVAGGFTCLLYWAAKHGMFRDVEGPKYTMLDNERQLDEHDPRTRSHTDA